MRRAWAMAWAVSTLATLAGLQQSSEPPQQPRAPTSTRYHERPDHPWNRLHVALALRTGSDGSPLGLDEPDLLLWPDSRHLLEPARRESLLQALASAASAPAEERVVDPLPSVLMQQDLWALFDWAADTSGAWTDEETRARTSIAAATAATLHALAPRAADLTHLPDPLAAADASWKGSRGPDPLHPLRPFLPPGLADPDGGWVLLAAEGGGPLTPSHSAVHAGRSSFQVLLRLPEGRDVTQRFLAELGKHANTSTCAGCGFEPGVGPHEHLSRDLPPLPPGSAVALVRRALALDSEGVLHATQLVQSVQVRVFLDAPPAKGDETSWQRVHQPGFPWQAFAELRLDPARLMAGDPAALAPVREDQSVFRFLGTHGDEVAWSRLAHERAPHLQSCVGCHGSEGLASINAFTGIMSGPGTHHLLALRAPPRRIGAADLQSAFAAALAFKHSRPDWAALQARR